VGSYLVKELEILKKKYPHIIKGIKGKGLMLGIELHIDGTALPVLALKEGLLIKLYPKAIF